ncbi:hypothetical protein B5807_08526 [Epicoccum nigrum]|uniref:Uncharacterized protein n=1 Tax=Epicoccum nigrum TaxID=105696 RepID=A0A1Y2LQU5_EPING|nr:hypothetical protein B5807_08526 [Epicoccum nigrum]
MQEAMQKFEPRRELHLLQQDHGHTGGNSAEHSHAHTHARNDKARGAGSSVTGVGRARARGLGSRGDGASASSTSLLEEVGAARGGRGSLLSSGLALEAAAVGDSLSIGVESEGKLLLGGAHAVGSVGTGGHVAVDTSAVLAVLETADVAEDVTEVVFGGLVGYSAAKGLHHAGAKLLVGDRREGVRFGLPLSGGDLGAGSSSSVGRVVVSHLDTAGGSLGDLLGEVVEILVRGDLAVLDSGQTVLVGLLEVHVDNTTGPDTSHLVAVESTDLSELTRTRGVAAVLGEENGNVVLLKLLGTDIKTGLLERRVTAPRVDVVAPEVDGRLAITAIEVVRQVLTDVSIVVGGVTDTDRAVVLALDVSLAVTDGSLDECRSQSVVGLVRDLVTSKETEGVVVLHQLIDDAGVAVVKGSGPLRIVAVDGVARLGQVSDNVDSGISKGVHALLVVF